jgi:hypothetical protein
MEMQGRGKYELVVNVIMKSGMRGTSFHFLLVPQVDFLEDIAVFTVLTKIQSFFFLLIFNAKSHCLFQNL